MSFFTSLKDKMAEFKIEAMKYKNKDFMNASMAGSALIAMADGTVSADEKQKMMKFIESNEALSIYTTSDVIKAFQEYLGQIEFDKDIGESKAYQAIGKIKGNNEAARLLIRMIIGIAASDGNFEDREKKVAAKIARELGLNPAEFELT